MTIAGEKTHSHLTRCLEPWLAGGAVDSLRPVFPRWGCCLLSFIRQEGNLLEVADESLSWIAYPLQSPSFRSELPISLIELAAPGLIPSHFPLPILPDHCLPFRAKGSIHGCLDTSCSLQIGQMKSILMNLEKPR